MEEGRVGGGHDSGSPPEGSLPPRKRKVSHEVGEDARDGREGAKIHLTDHHKGGLNGHEQREEETARGARWPLEDQQRHHNMIHGITT